MSSPTGEWCRRCLDEGGGPLVEHPVLVPADGIVWGKLCPPDALGPRCLDCIEEQLGSYAAGSVRRRDHQWAIYPLDHSAVSQPQPESVAECE